MEQTDKEWMKTMYSLDHTYGRKTWYSQIIHVSRNLLLIVSVLGAGIFSYVAIDSFLIARQAQALLAAGKSDEGLAKLQEAAEKSPFYTLSQKLLPRNESVPETPASAPSENTKLFTLLNDSSEVHLGGAVSNTVPQQADPLPTAPFTPFPPTVSYTLYYYEITNMTPKNRAATPVIIAAQKKDPIDHVLRTNTIAPAVMNGTAIVFIDPAIIKNATQYSIVRQERTLHLPVVSEKDQSGVDYKNNVLVLSSNLIEGELESAFTHALGHRIFYDLTLTEFHEYMQLRKMDLTIITPWDNYILNHHDVQYMPTYADDWKTSPLEDFAETFTVMYATNTAGGNWSIETSYGMIDRPVEEWFARVVQPKLQ